MKNNISIPKNIKNPYIFYALGPQLRNSNTDFTLSNCLFGSVKLTKNADLDKYRCSGYSIGSDCRSDFLLTNRRNEKNVIIFGSGMTSSGHVDNNKKVF